MSETMKNKIINIILFLLVAFLLPLICVLLMRIDVVGNNNFLSLILYGIEGASPFIAVVIVCLIRFNKEEIKSFFKERYINNLTLKSVILAFLSPIAILTIAKLIAYSIGDTTPFFSTISLKKFGIILWALIAEELGWRGFLQPLLNEMAPKHLVPAIVGVVWCLWHYHFIISGSMDVEIFPFLIGCIAESYGYYMITSYCKNNIVPASIWHFVGNLFFNLYRFDSHWHNGSSKFYVTASLCYLLCVIVYILFEMIKDRKKKLGD